MTDETDAVIGELNGVKVAMAELRVEVRHLTRSVEYLSTKLDSAPNAKDIAALDVRLTKVEANLSKAAWAIIGAWVSGIGVVLTYIIKAM
jgi:hypothetical protein